MLKMPRHIIVAVGVLGWGTAIFAKAPPSTLPADDEKPGHHWLDPIIRQGIIDAMAIPEVVDGKPQGPAVRTNELLAF